MGLSEITKPCIYPLHLLKSLFLLPVPQVAQKSYFIAERCQNFKQALSLSPASLSFFPLIPGRLDCGPLLTLTCSSARIMLASLSILWGRTWGGARKRGVFQTAERDRVKMEGKGWEETMQVCLGVWSGRDRKLGKKIKGKENGKCWQEVETRNRGRQ